MKDTKTSVVIDYFISVINVKLEIIKSQTEFNIIRQEGYVEGVEDLIKILGQFVRDDFKFKDEILEKIEREKSEIDNQEYILEQCMNQLPVEEIKSEEYNEKFNS